MLFEIFQLKEPEWTDDFHLALLSVGKRMKGHIFLRESVMNLVLVDLGLESLSNLLLLRWLLLCKIKSNPCNSITCLAGL